METSINRAEIFDALYLFVRYLLAVVEWLILSRMGNQKMKKQIAHSTVEKRVYNVYDIMQLLEISRNTAYAFVKEVYGNKKPFPVLKVKSAYRIPREPFDDWLRGNSTSLEQ